MHEHMLLAYWAIILTSVVLTMIQVQLQTQFLLRFFAYEEPSLSFHGIWAYRVGSSLLCCAVSGTLQTWVFATFHIGLDKLKAAYFSFRPGHTEVGAVRKEWSATNSAKHSVTMVFMDCGLLHWTWNLSASLTNQVLDRGSVLRSKPCLLVSEQNVELYPVPGQLQFRERKPCQVGSQVGR